MSTPPNKYNAESAFEREAWDGAEQDRLGTHLVEGALYAQFTFEDGRTVTRLPQTLDLYCSSCEKEQTFERTTVPTGSDDFGWAKSVVYRCRNCQARYQAFLYTWNKQGFWKVGQTPEVRERIDPALKKALGKSIVLYQKAVRSRNFGFGVGAVTYLRRIIEDKTSQLMDLLKDEKWNSWSEEERAEFENARKTYQYSQKIEYAAEKILPPRAFANGRDSFTALHDVVSSGIHSKTEEECIEIFDRCNVIFTRTFQILHEHKREREEFAAQLTALKR